MKCLGGSKCGPHEPVELVYSPMLYGFVCPFAPWGQPVISDELLERIYREPTQDQELQTR